MIQIGEIIIDFGYSSDWSIIITVFDIYIMCLFYLLSRILGELKIIRKFLFNKE